MSFVTWNDVYQELWRNAAQSRGTITTVGDLPGAPRYSTLPEWPRTIGADLIAIASLVDPILSETPLRPGGYGITRLWQTQVIEIESIAFANPTSEYVHNRAFWSTLLAVAAHLCTMGAPTPDDEAWEALTGALWSPAIDYRNAAGPTSHTITAATFSEMWEALRADHARARGVDVRDDELGGALDVPRTTNADVLMLEGYWSRPLVQLQVGVMTGALPSPDDFEDIQLEWQAITGRVDVDAVHGTPSRAYPGNLEFWRASRALAVALDLLQVRPLPYVVIDEMSASPVAPGRPPAPSPAPSPAPAKPKPAPMDLSSRLNNLADHALTKVAQAVNDAGDRLVATVGRPLLFTGATLAALLLVLHATARCECEPEPEPERAPDATAEAEAEAKAG
jgi:hypothetical protein